MWNSVFSQSIFWLSHVGRVDISGQSILKSEVFMTNKTRIHLHFRDLSFLSQKSAAAHPHPKSLCSPWWQQQQQLPQKGWLEDMIMQVLGKGFSWRYTTWMLFLQRSKQTEEKFTCTSCFAFQYAAHVCRNNSGLFNLSNKISTAAMEYYFFQKRTKKRDCNACNACKHINDRTDLTCKFDLALVGFYVRCPSWHMEHSRILYIYCIRPF